jgi:hypothetical protein
VIFELQKFVVKIGGLFHNGLMSLRVGSSTASLKIKHIVFVASYLDRGRRKKLGMLNLLKMVGQVGTRNID